MIRAQGARGIQPKRGAIADDGERGAGAVAEDVEHRQPQLARAQDRHSLARLHVATLQDVVTEPVHLDHGHDPHRHVVGQTVKVSLRNRHELAEAAVEI